MISPCQNPQTTKTPRDEGGLRELIFHPGESIAVAGVRITVEEIHEDRLLVNVRRVDDEGTAP